MNITIIGAGKVGQVLCAELAERHDISVVDLSDELIENIMNKYDVTGIVGNGINVTVQRQAGVEEADIFIAVTNSDEINIIMCTLAKNAGAKHTIARVRNPEYFEQIDFIKEALGISRLINPDLSAARDIVRTIRYASALSVQTLVGNRVALVEMEIQKHSILDQMSLSDFRQKYGTVIVCIIDRNGQTFIPSGSDYLLAEDKIFVSGLPKDMSVFQHKIGKKEKSIRSVFIIGGGRIAHYLLEALSHTRVDVKIIECNLERCEHLSSDYPFARVIHADGTDTEVLDEQELEKYDAFVSLTGVDEENLIASIYANKQGVRKVITKISRTNILKVLDDKRLKKIVAPKNLVANEIARFVRARENAEGSNVEALYRVANNQVEVLQFVVKKQCHAVNQPLSTLRLKPNLLIAYILRQGQILFPNGQDSIQVNDKVVVMTTQKDFTDLEDILEV